VGFHIYENWQAGPHKAVLHTGECAFCNEGRGLAGGSDPRYGKWHGPFDALTEARSAQRKMKVEMRSECRCVATPQK
jgi:F-type H+/Na+-transporting ATPase subunit beta